MFDWKKKSFLIDAKGPDNSWKVGEIIKADSENLTVMFDGIAEMTANYPIASKNIAPFRRYTCKNSGVNLRKEWKLNLDELGEMENIVHSHDLNGISELNPCQITQFYRGKLFFFIEALLDADYSKNLSVFNRVISFFTKTVKLLTKCLNEYLSLLPYYYQGLEDSEKFLQDKFIAMANTWPEVLDSLNKLLSGDLCYKKFFNGQNAFPSNYEFSSHTISSSESMTSLYLLNYFAKCRGFDILLNVFDTQVRKIPINFLSSICLGRFKVLLDPEFSEYFYHVVCQGILCRIIQIDENDIRDIDYSLLFPFMNNLKSTSEDVEDVMIEYQMVSVLCKMVKSVYMEKRVKGICELCGFCENLEGRSMSSNALFQIFRDENLIFEVLEDRVHAEILKRSYPVLKLYAEYEGFQLHECEIIWNLAQSPQKTISESAYSIILQVLPRLSPSYIDFFYKNLCSLNQKEINLKFLCDFSIKVVENNLDYDLLTNNLLFEALPDDSPMEKWKEALHEIERLLVIPNALQKKLQFFQTFSEKLAENNSVLQHISVIINLLPTFTEEELVQLMENLQILKKTIQNLKLYMESLDKEVSRDTIIGKYPHRSQVGLRLALLETIAKSTNFRVSLSGSEVKKVWKSLVLNNKSGIDKILFFKSFHHGYTSTPLSKDFVTIFQLFTNDKYFPDEVSSTDAFKAFKKIFFHVNSPANIELDNSKFKCIRSDSLQGFEKLVKILLHCENKIFQKAAQLVTSLMTFQSVDLFPISESIFSQFLSILFQDPLSSETRCLDFLIFLLNIEEPNSQYWEFPVINGETGETKIISLPSISKIINFRKLISESFKIQISQLSLFLNNQMYSHVQSYKLIQIEPKIQISVFIKEPDCIEFDPKQVLGNHPQVLKLLCECSETNEEKAWLILKHLPEAKSLPNLDDLIKKIIYSTPIHFLQILKIIKSLITSEKWLSEFTSKQGHLAFTAKYLQIQKTDIEIHIIQEEIIVIILSKILNGNIENPDKLLNAVYKSFIHVMVCPLELRKIKEYFEAYVEIVNYFNQNYTRLFQLKSRKFLRKNIGKIVELLLDNNGDYKYLHYFSKFASDLAKICGVVSICITEVLRYKEIVLKKSKIPNYWNFLIFLIEACEENADKALIYAEFSNCISTLQESSSEDLNESLCQILGILNLCIGNLDVNILDVAKELLLAMPSQANSFPHCRNPSTRMRAYIYLISLCKNSPKNQKILVDLLDQYHNTFIWRTSHLRDWEIPLEHPEKSSLGYIGLENPGCICYMNSLFQQLYMIQPLRDLFLQLEFKNQGSISYQLQQLFGKMKYSQGKSISTKKFLRNFKDHDGKPISTTEQMDADEFFARLMEKIEGEMREINEFSVIENFFGGVQVTEMISKECNHMYKNSEYFRSLSLDVKNKNSLEKSLESLVSGELLKGENAYFCQECKKKVTALMRTSVEFLPNFLTFALRRFEFDLDTMERMKLDDFFEFPIELNMEKYTAEYLNEGEMKTKDYYEYRLKGLIVHSGKAEHGHYFSYVFNENVWVEFNDTKISLSDFGIVKENAFGSPIRQGKSVSSAYLLIYERQEKYCFGKTQKFLKEPSEEKFDKALIEKKNSENWIKRVVFSNDYFYIIRYMTEVFENIQLFVLRFFLTISVRSPDLEPHQLYIYKYLEKELTAKETTYFFDVITSENGSKEFLLYNPSPSHRKLIVLLAKNTIHQLHPSHQCHFFYRCLRMSSYAYKQYSLHYSHCLELLCFFCKLLPEQCLQNKVVPNLIKIILKMENSMPSIENTTDQHLVYSGEYTGRHIAGNDKYGFIPTSAINFIAQSIGGLDENMVEYLKTEDAISSFLQLCENRLCVVAVCKMYANLYFGDIENAKKFVSFLFEKYLESCNSWYLNSLSVFFKYVDDKVLVIQNFLEVYIAMISQNSDEETYQLIKYLLKFLHRVKYCEIEAFFPQTNVESMRIWLFQHETSENSAYTHKLLNRLTSLLENSNTDSEEELLDQHLAVNSFIWVYDDIKANQYYCEIVENLHNELIAYKIIDKHRERIVLKESNSFCDILVEKKKK